MVAPQPVFQNIAEEITQFIQKADSEILVNLPWFTDESLFEELRLKAESGVAVSIGIEDDGINEKAPFDHRIIVRFGGRLYLHTKRGGKGINHEKYCVIDQRYVIFGSYNWTYSAARHNRESVVIFDDPALAKQYIQQFQGMTRLKRVTCVEQTPSTTPPVENGLIDPSLSLKMEIRLLETEVAQLETEKADLENKLEYATIYIQLALRDLLQEKLRVQAILAVYKASQTAKAVDRQQAEEQQRLVEEAENLFETIQERQQVLENEVDETSLKKQYREACVMAHPDKFFNNPDKQQKATELMSRLTAAYRDRNADLVREIWQSLCEGIAFGLDWDAPTDSETLKRIWDSLRQKKDDLLTFIEKSQQSHLYRIIQKSSLDEFIAAERQKLLTEIEILKQSIPSTNE